MPLNILENSVLIWKGWLFEFQWSYLLAPTKAASGWAEKNGETMKRRDFLRNSALMAAATVVPSAWADDGTIGTTPYAVLAQGSPSAAVKAAVDGLGGMSRFVKKGDKVVVKPNMSFSNPPSWATTTHPEVVKELVAQCVSSGASRVLVLDNPLKDVELCLEKSGLARACELFPETSVLGLQDRKFFREIKVPQGVDLKSTQSDEGCVGGGCADLGSGG